MARWVAIHRLGQATVEISRTLQASLPALDFQLRPAQPGNLDTMRLVLLSRLADSDRQQIRDWSDGGLRRMLVVVTGAENSEADAWTLLQDGGSDVLCWEEHKDPVAAIAARLSRWHEIDTMVKDVARTHGLVGTSAAWLALLRRVVEVARYTDAPILLVGETGTGKEQLARTVHTIRHQDNDDRFVLLDCSTLVPELSGSEFFGHERGAFTGAVAARDGAFALADGGTLFLDEIGELPPMLQAQLLRVVQEQTYKRVGSNTWRQTRFRLVCATNRDLVEDGATGRFRSDLYYRLAGWVCRLPALRDRRSDILPLARHFIALEMPGRTPIALSPTVERYLSSRPYPGNVRELRQLCMRIAHRHVGPGPITIGDIPEDERDGGVTLFATPTPNACFDEPVRAALDSGAPLKHISQLAEETAIRLVTSDEGGNLKRAALRLGVTERTLQLRRAAQRADPGQAGAATRPADGSAAGPG
jgi:transcriptional regulator with GAF, ATPase, and Fis domain